MSFNKLWGTQQKNEIYFWMNEMDNLAYYLDDYQPRSQKGFLKRARKTKNGINVELDVVWAYGVEWTDDTRCTDPNCHGMRLTMCKHRHFYHSKMPVEIIDACRAYKRLRNGTGNYPKDLPLRMIRQDQSLVSHVNNKYKIFSVTSIGFQDEFDPKSEDYRAERIGFDTMTFIEACEEFYRLNEELKTILQAA